PPTNVQSLKVVMWRHNGFGTGSKMSIYRSERVQESILDGKTPANFPNPNEPFQSDLGGGVTCSVPIALYADAEGTLPHTPTVKKDSALIQSTRVRRSADDRATRLAAVSLAWNVFQHFYPYFDVVKTDWPAELKQALQSAATDADERAFTLTLRRLVAALRDGHGNVGAPNAEMFAPGVVWDWIEERLVITEVKNSTSGLAPGDVVLTINGQPSARLLEETERSISGATPQWIRSRALREIAMGAKDTSLTLEIEPWASPGKRTQVAVKRDAQAWAIEEKRPARVAEIEAGVFYLDFDRISDQDFKEALPKLEQAKGIIFDLRGYPRNLNAMQLFPHLTEKPMTSAQWHVPVVTRPDRQNMQFMRGGEWQIAPRAPYLKARKAFITGGGAISYAESCMGIVEHYKLAEIVGGPTAGTNGNVNPFTVPGGYTIVWTGMKVLKQDGSQHHGVGIRPTIPVARTRAGVAAGRDELLERALQTVKGQ
ncbi:MAG: S41 family peptidase, partial [Blastocatellia bacterium]